MTIAETSQLTLSYVDEVDWGVTPPTPAWQRMRVTGESIIADIQNVTSNEIRPDRMISDLIQVGGGASGGWDFELTFGPDTDGLLEVAFAGTFAANELKAGTEAKSISLEKIFQATATQYMRFTGCRIDTLALQFQAQQIVTGSMAILGKGSVLDTSPVAGEVPVLANTNPVMAAPNVLNLTVNGATVGTYYSNLSVQLANNLRQQAALGNVDAIGIGYGQRNVTGTLVAYFEDVSIYQQFLAGTEGSISWETDDGSNKYTWTIPRTKFTAGRVVAGGNNQDVSAEMTFQGLADAAEGTDIKVSNA